jgi:hypothetical protein
VKGNNLPDYTCDGFLVNLLLCTLVKISLSVQRQCFHIELLYIFSRTSMGPVYLCNEKVWG